jgi:hypothetical protein
MRTSIIRKSSAWDVAGIEKFLQNTLIPLRLSCLSRTGYPLISSLWFYHDADALWCATQAEAHIAALLEINPQCGFEVAGDAPPYRGVRGQGRAMLSKADGADVLGRLIDRYLGSRDSDFARWLLARGDKEVSIRIEPEWLTSWDYASRM